MEKHNIDWDDPAARLGLIEAIGLTAYNEAMQQHLKDSVIQTVNGHGIRPINTQFGRLFAVGSTGRAFSTIEVARQAASTHPNPF